MAGKNTRHDNGSKTDNAEMIKLPAMSKKEIEELLKSSKICRMALNDRVQPYLICLDYAYVDGKMYFHFANYGRKMELLEKDMHVSVELDQYNKSVTKYKNATFMGKLVKVTNGTEKKRASEALLSTIKTSSGKKKVAARHGYDKLDEEAFLSGSSLFMRLDVNDYVALKSPGSNR